MGAHRRPDFIFEIRAAPIDVRRRFRLLHTGLRGAGVIFSVRESEWSLLLTNKIAKPSRMSKRFDDCWPGSTRAWRRTARVTSSSENVCSVILIGRIV